jgi:hypothetical protein
MSRQLGLLRPRASPRRRVTLLVLAAGTLPGAAPPDLELTFAPRAGARVAKRTELAVELLDTTITFGGIERRFGEDAVIRLVASLAFVDTYTRVTDGVPRDLQRRFDQVDGSWELNGKRNEIEDFSALAGCTVRFEWSPEREDHVRSLTVDGADVPRLGERIDRLVEDLDLRAFLPGASVRPGSRWTATGEPVMHALFGPLEAGLVGIPAGISDEALIRDVLLRPFRTLGNDELDVQCVLARDERDDGDPEVEIDLGLTDRFELDITSEVTECLRAWGRAGSAIVVAGAAIAWRCDGKGQLVWDRVEQRCASFELKVRVDVDCRIDLENSTNAVGKRDHSLQLRSKCDATWSMVAEALPEADEDE